MIDSADPPSTAESIHDVFVADHRRFDDLAGRLLAAFDASDGALGEKLWNELCAGLTVHLEAEEKFMIPALARTHQREARALLAEHKLIRDRLTEIGTAVAKHVVCVDVVRAFVHELNAHACHEGKILYAWGDAWLDETERALLFAYRENNASSAASSSSTFTGLVR